jgi:tetratricopeptide (TPR) repeat protein
MVPAHAKGGNTMTYGNSSEYENAAIELLFGGKPQQALELFEEGLRRFPGDAGLSVGCGMALNDLKRPAEAREIFLQVAEKNPNLTDALQGLTAAELALGNKAAAAAAARKACDHPGEGSADFVHSLGILLYRHELHADSEYCYRRAVEIDRTHGLSWVGLASSLHHQGKRDEAINLLKEAVEDRLPGFWEGYSYLGCMLCDAGRTEEALKLLSKIPLDELRDPAAVRRLRSHLNPEKHPERAKILAVIEERARAALAKDQPKQKKAPIAQKDYSEEPWLGTFVVGPVRGDYENLIKVLKGIEAIDERGNWLGRKLAIVALGPIHGSGRAKVKALRYLEKLKKQAERRKGPGYVAIVGAPGEDVGFNPLGHNVDDHWLVSHSGISGKSLVKAWEIVRARYVGGGPYRPPVLRALTGELVCKPEYWDGSPDCDTASYHLLDGQICAAAGDPDVRFEREGDKLIRVDSGLGDGLRLICFRYLNSKWDALELPLAQERFQALKADFAKTFGLEFPPSLEPDKDQEPMHPLSNGILAFSRAVKQEGVLLPVMPDNFEAAPRGTWMVGQWGYGANSYAFYFVRKDSRREIFLRLFYGGAYGNPTEDAAHVKTFLERYIAFEAWAGTNLKRWRIENNMGDCLGWIEYPDERREELGHGLAGNFQLPNERP